MNINGRRAVAGLCMLCALLVSALAAQGASAIGTTAYTCTTSKAGTMVGEKFSDGHCKTPSVGGSVTHTEIPLNLTTELKTDNETTDGAKENTLLKATIAGSAFTLTSTTTTGSGWMTNATEGGEMYAHGDGLTTFTGVTASGGCKVFTDSGAGKGEEGVIHTEPLRSTTRGQGDSVKVEPKEGTVFARFTLEGCTNTGINGTYTVTGSVKTTSIEGATTRVTHANTTEQNTLKLNGTIKAGIEGVKTPQVRANSGEQWTALSATT